MAAGGVCLIEYPCGVAETGLGVAVGVSTFLLSTCFASIDKTIARESQSLLIRRFFFRYYSTHTTRGEVTQRAIAD